MDLEHIDQDLEDLLLSFKKINSAGFGRAWQGVVKRDSARQGFNP